MSGLGDIAVRVELQPPAGGLGGAVVAIAAEIASLVDRLATEGEAGAIDLRSLPMTAADRARLREFLGAGEVQITIDADGLSTVWETATAGVWWAEHRNSQGQLIAELVEVCRVPDILMLAQDALVAGSRRLRERVEALAPPVANKL